MSVLLGVPILLSALAAGRVTGEADGSRRRAIGLGDAAVVEGLGLARAKGYDAQVRSLRR